MGFVFWLLEEQDSRMKLLCLAGLLVCSISLADAADFKHFPVQAGRAVSSEAEERRVATPARPPGKRERARDPVRKNAIVLLDPSSDEDEDVSKVRVTSTTERVRVNRNRIRSRTRIATSEKKVETTAKPARQRIRIRTKPPRQGITSRRQRPTVEIPTFTTIGMQETSTEEVPVRNLNRFPAERVVVKQGVNHEITLTMDPFHQNRADSKPAIQTPKVIPKIAAEIDSQRFSQSLTGLIQPAIPPAVNRFAADREPQRFVQVQAQPQQKTFVPVGTKPTPLRVFTGNDFRAQKVDAKPVPQPFQSQPTVKPFKSQAQQFQLKPQVQPFKSQPQVQQFQPQPQVQQFQSQPQVQTFQSQPKVQPFQSQPQLKPFQSQPQLKSFQPQIAIPQFNTQSQPQPQGPSIQRTRPQEEVFQSQQIASQPPLNAQSPRPSFEERPSLFSSPIEIPQNGAGASFSYEAIVG